jgi:hypothetical protein
MYKRYNQPMASHTIEMSDNGHVANFIFSMSGTPYAALIVVIRPGDPWADIVECIHKGESRIYNIAGRTPNDGLRINVGGPHVVFAVMGSVIGVIPCPAAVCALAFGRMAELCKSARGQ